MILIAMFLHINLPLTDYPTPWATMVRFYDEATTAREPEYKNTNRFVFMSSLIDYDVKRLLS